MMEYKIADHIAAMKPSAIREIFKVLVDPEVIALSAGSPDSSAYPARQRATRRFASRPRSACARNIRPAQMMTMLSSQPAVSRQSACLPRP